MGQRFEKSDTPLGGYIEEWVKVQPVPRIITFVAKLVPLIEAVRGRSVGLANLEREVRLWRREGALPPEYREPVAAVLGIDPALIEIAASERPKLERLRYTISNIDLYRTLAAEELSCDMSVTFHNPNDFEIRFEGILEAWINEKVRDAGPTEVTGFVDPHSDVSLHHDLMVDFLLTRTPKPGLPCLLALLDYDIDYQPAFARAAKARKAARLRFVSWEWPFKDRAGVSEFKLSGYSDDEVEELIP